MDNLEIRLLYFSIHYRIVRIHPLHAFQQNSCVPHLPPSIFFFQRSYLYPLGGVLSTSCEDHVPNPSLFSLFPSSDQGQF